MSFQKRQRIDVVLQQKYEYRLLKTDFNLIMKMEGFVTVNFTRKTPHYLLEREDFFFNRFIWY